MKRLIVHIGMRKTGSTSIQNTLATRAADLRRDGVYAPRTGNVPHNRGTQRGLVRELHLARSPLWRRLAQEIHVAAEERFVLSVEDLAHPWCRTAAVARLVDFAARERLDVDVIAYVRPQWQIIESEYTKRVCGREVGTPVRFPCFARGLLAAKKSDTILDYAALFAAYRKAFGALAHISLAGVVAAGRSRAPLPRADRRAGHTFGGGRRTFARTRERTAGRQGSGGVASAASPHPNAAGVAEAATITVGAVGGARRCAVRGLHGRRDRCTRSPFRGRQPALRHRLRHRRLRDAVPGGRRWPGASPEYRMLGGICPGRAASRAASRAPTVRYRPRRRLRERGRALCAARALGVA